uniref:Methyltransferase n=1 Tax=Anthurium amnicola TaxID=1678845 RepID=A0A1D1Y9B4_9ARAE
MAAVKFLRSAKRPPLGFCAKVSLVVLLGLAFFVIWSTFSSSPSSVVSSRRNSFGDVEPEEVGLKESGAHSKPTASTPQTPTVTSPVAAAASGRSQEEEQKEEHSDEERSRKSDAEEVAAAGDEVKARKDDDAETAAATRKNVASKPESSEEEEEGGDKKGDMEIEEVAGEEGGIDGDLEEGVDVNAADEESKADETTDGKTKKIKKKKLGPLFDPRARYSWKSCGTRKGPNYIPCVDLEDAGSGKFQGHRHHERSCPRTPPMCLVPHPPGYRPPISWPDSQSQIFYRNVAHPKLSAYIKSHSYLRLAADLLLFPHNESVFQGGAAQYLDFIDEMVPDIEWGKTIRIVLDIGSTDASFGAALLEKEVLTLSLGLMDDQTDLAQLSLERGFPALVSNLRTRRLPFPSGVFDAIHCGECNIPWHSDGGKLLLEMNRILRPGGYFIMSFKHRDIEGEEGMSALTASICWNILAHKNDEDSDLGVKIYQRPSSNDIYELRRRNNPPLCKENEKQDAAWYTPMKTCLHTIPAAIEQRGTDWPEEWPKRLETFPEWLADSQERLIADAEHWKSVVNKSYLSGMGVDWPKVRNIMDMKAIYGGLAAALASQRVWVMNVVPVHAPNTLPVIFERGLLGIYHDWCEPFSTYPRSYDLLHADHLFARLKNRCKQPVNIVVEMDRILRPGGWVIVRDKLEILNPLEEIVRTLHWEIRMTYAQDKEGIICAQKTTWRP